MKIILERQEVLDLVLSAVDSATGQKLIPEWMSKHEDLTIRFVQEPDHGELTGEIEVFLDESKKPAGK